MLRTKYWWSLWKLFVICVNFGKMIRSSKLHPDCYRSIDPINLFNKPRFHRISFCSFSNIGGWFPCRMPWYCVLIELRWYNNADWSMKPWGKESKLLFAVHQMKRRYEYSGFKLVLDHYYYFFTQEKYIFLMVVGVGRGEQQLEISVNN